METTRRKAITRALAIVLALLVICSVLNWGIVTGWGSVRITNVTLVGDNGHEYTALVYTPKNATNETPAPAYLCSHGYSGNARNHESWAMEYARRGFVVLSLDNFGSGDGEFNETPNSAADRSLSNADNVAAVDCMLTYLMNMPIVDTENVVLGGHSMGCNTAIGAVKNRDIKAMVLADPALFGPVNVREGFVSNVLWLYGTADKLYTVDDSLAKAAECFTAMGADLGDISAVEDGKTYKNHNGYIYRHELIEDQIHEAAFINSTSIGLQIDFVQEVIDAPNPISGRSQIWQWKDVMGMIGTLLFAAFLCILALFLMAWIPSLGTLIQPLPRNIGLRGKGFGISVLAAIAFPFIAVYFGCFGILKLFGAISAYGNKEYGIFRLRFTNISIGVVITLTLLGLIMLVVYLLTDGKKQKATLHDLGLTTEGRTTLDFQQIGKALLLAILTAFIGWTYLALQRSILRTDFYCLFFGVKAIASRKFIYYIPYIVIWMVCFAVSSISMNVERRMPSTGNEKKDTIIAVVFNALLNCLAITLMVIIENYCQVHNGAGAYGFPNWGTDVTRLWGMPLGMFIGGAGNTYCYRKTGSVWLGAFLFGIVAALMACTFGQVRLA